MRKENCVLYAFAFMFDPSLNWHHVSHINLPETSSKEILQNIFDFKKEKRKQSKKI